MCLWKNKQRFQIVDIEIEKRFQITDIETEQRFPIADSETEQRFPSRMDQETLLNFYVFDRNVAQFSCPQWGNVAQFLCPQFGNVM